MTSNLDAVLARVASLTDHLGQAAMAGSHTLRAVDDASDAAGRLGAYDVIDQLRALRDQTEELQQRLGSIDSEVTTLQSMVEQQINGNSSGAPSAITAMPRAPSIGVPHVKGPGRKSGRVPSSEPKPRTGRRRSKERSKHRSERSWVMAPRAGTLGFGAAALSVPAALTAAGSPIGVAAGAGGIFGLLAAWRDIQESKYKARHLKKRGSKE